MNPKIIFIFVLVNAVQFCFCTLREDYECQISISKSVQSTTNGTSRITRDISFDGEILPRQGYYFCPGKDYPADYKFCCGHNQCCASSYVNFHTTDRDLPYVIVISALLICFLFIVTLALCCFWPYCPLYNSCRIRYYHDDTSCTNKFSEQVNFSTMPNEPLGNCVMIEKRFDSDTIEDKKVINIAGGDLIKTTRISMKSSDEFAV